MRRTHLHLTLALALSTGATHALAQSYPAKPVRLIVPVAAGGGSDILGRMIGQKLAENLGVQVTPDNRPGGSGIIGMDIVAQFDKFQRDEHAKWGKVAREADIRVD